MTLILMKFAGGGTEKFEVSFSRWKSFKVIMNTKRTILINLPRHLEFKVNFTRAFHLVIIFYGFIGCFCLVLAYVVSEEYSGNETTCHFFQCSSNIADHILFLHSINDNIADGVLTLN